MSAERRGASGPPAAGDRCTICGKPATALARPFCSKRCADVDLQRWLSGRYAIPVEDPGDPPEPAEG